MESVCLEPAEQPISFDGLIFTGDGLAKGLVAGIGEEDGGSVLKVSRLTRGKSIWPLGMTLPSDVSQG